MPEFLYISRSGTHLLFCFLPSPCFPWVWWQSRRRYPRYNQNASGQPRPHGPCRSLPLSVLQFLPKHAAHSLSASAVPKFSCHLPSPCSPQSAPESSLFPHDLQSDAWPHGFLCGYLPPAYKSRSPKAVPDISPHELRAESVLRFLLLLPLKSG